IANGTVEYAGWHDHGYGYMVTIVHDDGSRSLYAHNSDLLVVQGSQVLQGDVIALSGNTGRSTHPHLHLELIVGGRYVNPCDYLPNGC
ncbi:MAG: M23 family metallopeptidase, partial [Sphaerospermopsis sp. SIO1G2]|nr:M23 family metallopeptidase [Sphaerospermopsis sp. SIO1G2]